MSPSTWTACEGACEPRPLTCRIWRVVESQYVTSTRKLVDTDEEQALLEDLLDSAKPPRPSGPGFEDLHYLLYTPFRYPPLRHGSRFGTRSERSLFYGAIALHTAFAEVAFYRLLFLEGTSAELSPVEVELSAFRVDVAAARSLDLTAPPFDVEALSSPTSYATPQALGREMRAAGIQAFRFRSARCPRRGANVGLFEPAFARPRPSPPQGWVCVVDRARVELRKRDVFQDRRLSFERPLFEVDGRLPAPAA